MVKNCKLQLRTLLIISSKDPLRRHRPALVLDAFLSSVGVSEYLLVSKCRCVCRNKNLVEANLVMISGRDKFCYATDERSIVLYSDVIKV